MMIRPWCNNAIDRLTDEKNLYDLNLGNLKLF